ncbi:MAG: hypothetical protein JKY51_02260, partial [Opitutaceae bacterium]|nr:hypothetical protein [Opitutaceae bacterium]
MNSKSVIVMLSIVLCGIMGLPNSSHAEGQIQDKGAKALYAYTPVYLYEGGFYPVVGVKKKKALINVDGRLISVKKKSEVYIFATHSLVPLPIQIGVDRMGWEKVTPMAAHLMGAYGVFLSYSDSGITDLDWRNLKYTKKGRKTVLKTPLPPGRQGIRNSSRYMLLVFQDGKELVPLSSPQRKNLLSWLENKAMAQITGSYLKETRKQEADPSLFFKPEFDLSESDFKLLEGK